MIGVLKKPLDASRNFMGRLFHSAARAEQRRVEVEFARKIRPAFAFSIVEGVLGLCTLADAGRRKSWLSYVMGVALLFVACAHAFTDIRDGKILDILAEKLS